MKNILNLLLVSLALTSSALALPGRIQNSDVKSYSDIKSAVLTTTGNLNGTACIASPGSTTGLVTGLYIYDSTTPGNITVGTTIAGLPGTCSAGQIQMSAVANGTATGDTITFGGSIAELINDTKIYVSVNGINDQLSNAITNGVLGSSGGSKNYLTKYIASLNPSTANTGNGDFELNATTGFSLFNTTLTSGIPTGSISAGASSITTFATTSSNVLEKKYSLNIASSGAITAGQGWISDAFYIDRTDQSKVLGFSIKYSIISGSANINQSGTSSNTFAVYIYDVTNSAWIQPSGVYNMIGDGTFKGTFQTSSSGTNYRIAVLAVNASGGAASLNWDSYSVGPQVSVSAPAINDAVSFTPTGSWTSNTTYTGSYSRVGERMKIYYSVSLSGAPNNALLTLNLPSGYSIDTTKLQATGLGDIKGTFQGLHAGGGYIFSAYYSTPTSFQVSYNISDPSAESNVGQTAPVTWANGDSINGSVEVPIVGWSSNTVSSADSDTRVVALRAARVATQSLTSGVATQIAYDTVYNDTHGGFTTGASAQYKVPITGYYAISSGVQFAPNATSTRYQNLLINGSSVGTYGVIAPGNASDYATSSFSVIRLLNVGDTIAIQATQVSGGSLNISDGTAANDRVYLEINRLSGPAVTQATESVSFAYNSGSGQQNISNATTTTVTIASVKEYDSHNAVSSGVFSAPSSGTYHFDAGTQLGQNATGVRILYLVCTGVPNRLLSYQTGNASIPVQMTAGGDCKLKQGDTAQIQVYQSSGGTLATANDSTGTFFHGHRVGNY